MKTGKVQRLVALRSQNEKSPSKEEMTSIMEAIERLDNGEASELSVVYEGEYSYIEETHEGKD